MKTTTRSTYVPPNVTVRVVPDLDNGAELGWSSSGDVTLRLSPRGAFPGNMPFILRWAAAELEKNMRPDCSGYLPKRRLTLVPALTDLIPAQRDGAE